MKYPLTKLRWQAIMTNDHRQDTHFFYGVKTTKIFCKPSCASKLPNKENIVIFKTVQEALTAGFRPCKRCQPTGEKLIDQQWTLEIKKYLAKNYQQKIDLEILAEDCHGSISNLQRTFKRETGLSPTQYLTDLRLQHACKLLLLTNYSIKTIALRVGFNSDTYFMTVFKRQFHQTPQQYRQNWSSQNE